MRRGEGAEEAEFVEGCCWGHGGRGGRDGVVWTWSVSGLDWIGLRGPSSWCGCFGV